MRIATAAVYVEDQPTALQFWTEQVGWVVRVDRPMGPAGHWIEVGPKEGGSCVVLYPKPMMKDWAERKPSLVFEVADIEQAYREMCGRGVKFQEPPKAMPWGPFAIFFDPEGNSFGLRQAAS